MMKKHLFDSAPKVGARLRLRFDSLEADGSASAPIPHVPAPEPEGRRGGARTGSAAGAATAAGAAEAPDANGTDAQAADALATWRVHAPGPLPGQKSDVRITALSRHHPIAYAESLHAPSERAKAACHHAAPLRGACGGCPWMHVPQPLRIDALDHGTRALLAALPLDTPPPLHMHPAKQETGWRNRTNLLPFRNAAGALHLGSRARGGNTFSPMRGCLAVEPALRDMADALELFLRERSDALAIAAPDTPGLRWLSLRALRQGVLITWRHDLPEGSERNALLSIAREAHDALRPLGTEIRLQDGPINRIHGGTQTHVIGAATGTLTLAGVKHVLDGETFFQLHTAMAEQMIAVALEHLGEKGPIWDVFSGTGAFGLGWARKHGQPVYALESNPSSVALGQARAEALDLPFHMQELDIAGAARGALDALPRPAGMVVDPPRSGLRGALTDDIIGSGAERVVYVACGEEALTRDLTRWLEAGYALEAVHVFELLPMTGHAERLALLRRER